MAVAGLSAMAGNAPAAQEPKPRLAPRETWTYVGNEKCEECHDDVMPIFEKTEMGRVLLKAPRNPTEKLGCESCHGPGSEHSKEAFKEDPNSILSFGPKWKNMSVREMNDKCLQCHTKGEQTFWARSVHRSRGVACVNCHTIMQVISDEKQLVKATQSEVCAQCHPVRKAQLLRNSHMPLREGKMACGDCHNPHGSVTSKGLRGKSINETCYRCHAEKRGPFLWEHAPVRENCSNCHDAHGSLHDKLLVVKRERLCQRCHIETRHPTTPHDPTARFDFGHSCQNCHSQIHGSNHPAGKRFQR
jgi:DmsE family decaheme c-type cytochrome